MPYIFRKYLHSYKAGPVDAKLVRDYLLLQRPQDLAIIAAQIAPRTGESNPDQLAESALAILKAAGSLHFAEQKRLLEQMNGNTLLELHHFIHGAHDIDLMPYGNPKRIHDPIASSLIVHLRHIREKMPEEFSERENKRIAQILSKVKKPRPSLPCSLEKALKYAAEDNSANAVCLERAYIDWLALTLIDEAIYRDYLPGLGVSTREHGRQNPNNQDPNTNLNQQSEADQISEQSADIFRIRDERLRVLKKWKDEFIPGWEPQEDLKNRAIDRRDYFQANGIKAAQLADLVEGFGVFWRRYGPKYVELAQVNLRKKESNQKKATNTTIKRETDKWYKVTLAFCDNLLQSGVFPRRDGRLELIINQCVYSDRFPSRTAKDTAEKFLKTLWSAATTPGQSSVIFEKLVKEDGFKTINIDFLYECLDRLVEVRDNLEKKSK